MARTAALALGLGLTLASGTARAAAPPGASPYEFQLIPSGGGTPRSVVGWERDGILYIAAADVGLLLDAPKYWRPELGRLTLIVGRHEISATDGSDIATIDSEQLVHLPGPVFRWEGRMMLPLDLLVDADGKPRPWIEEPLSFSRKDRKLRASSTRRRTSVSGASIRQGPAGWTLVLAANGSVDFDLVRTERSGFVLRLPGLEYDPLQYPLPTEHRGYQGLRLRNLPDGLEVSFTPNPRVVGYRVSRHHPEGVEVFLGLDERDLRSGSVREFSEARSPASLAVRMIALDPGHGEGDPGVAVNGGREAKLAFDLCRITAELVVDDLRMDVFLTRDDRDSPGKVNRVERANQIGADVLVSVHLHARPGGPAGFVMADQGSGEISSPGYETLGFRALGAGEATAASTSRRLARDVVDAVAGQLGESSLGIHQETLPELSMAGMPAMVLELGSGSGNARWTRERLEHAAAGIIEGLRLFLMSEGEGR